MDAGLAADHQVTVDAKQLRLELLKVKADLERELGTWVLDCKACGMDVHWVRASAWRTLGTGGIASLRRTGSRRSSRGTRAAPGAGRPCWPALKHLYVLGGDPGAELAPSWIFASTARALCPPTLTRRTQCHLEYVMHGLDRPEKRCKRPSQESEIVGTVPAEDRSK